VVAAGGDIRDFAGHDLVISMTGYLSPTGEYDSTASGPVAHAEAMLGLLVAGAEVDESAVDWLVDAHADGDWGGPDSNGIALNVLGRLGLSVPEAVAHLRTTQTADGGWGFEGTNPSATSEVRQGLVQVGENPFVPNWSQVVSGTVANGADAVLAMQGENGCWPNQFGPGDDPFSTTDAIILLVQQPPWPAAAAFVEGEAEAEVAEAATATPEPTGTAVPTDTPMPTATPALTATAEPTQAPAAEVATATETVTDTEPTAETETPEAAAPGIRTSTIVLVVIVVLVIGGGLFWLFEVR
jgi:hypothetical protein